MSVKGTQFIVSVSYGLRVRSQHIATFQRSRVSSFGWFLSLFVDLGRVALLRDRKAPNVLRDPTSGNTDAVLFGLARDVPVPPSAHGVLLASDWLTRSARRHGARRVVLRLAYALLHPHFVYRGGHGDRLEQKEVWQGASSEQYRLGMK